MADNAISSVGCVKSKRQAKFWSLCIVVFASFAVLQCCKNGRGWGGKDGLEIDGTSRLELQSSKETGETTASRELRLARNGQTECCHFPGDCAHFCPFTSTSFARKKCTNEHQVVCLKGKQKSGTTWTEYLVKGLLETVCNAYPKDCQYKETKNMKAPNPELNRNYHLYWGGQKKLTFTAGDFLEKGCFKHGPPDPAKHPDHGAILVLRDPRDVIVSRHFYTRHHDPYVPDKYVRQQLAELQTYFGKVEKNYRLAEATDSGAVAFLRYEELNKNSVESMRMLFNFLPLSCFAEFDVSFAEEVYDRFAFEKMTKAEDQGRVAGTTGARKGSEKKVRSGRSFGFTKNLRPQTLKQVEAALNKDKMFGPLFQQYYENEVAAGY